MQLAVEAIQPLRQECKIVANRSLAYKIVRLVAGVRYIAKPTTSEGHLLIVGQHNSAGGDFTAANHRRSCAVLIRLCRCAQLQIPGKIRPSGYGPDDLPACSTLRCAISHCTPWKSPERSRRPRDGAPNPAAKIQSCPARPRVYYCPTFRSPRSVAATPFRGLRKSMILVPHF
jgi:hypothetical protein